MSGTGNTGDMGHTGHAGHAGNTEIVTDQAPADGAVVHHDSHGQTPAAWTLVGIVMIATLLGGIAVLIESWSLFWIGGVGLAALGVIVGKAMGMLGYGKHSPAVTDTLPR